VEVGVRSVCCRLSAAIPDIRLKERRGYPGHPEIVHYCGAAGTATDRERILSGGGQRDS
jgi:hypothetical protein